MSVRWMRTAKISNGRYMEAIAWGKEVTSSVEKKHGSPKIHTWLDSFGEIATIRWTMDAPDIATIEKVQIAILQDADYWKMVGKAREQQLFIDGSVTDYISREV